MILKQLGDKLLLWMMLIIPPLTFIYVFDYAGYGTTSYMLENHKILKDYTIEIESFPDAGEDFVLDIGGVWEFAKYDIIKSSEELSWEPVKVPFNLKNLDNPYTGYCWYRLKIKFPITPPTYVFSIELGYIDDLDITYLNGNLLNKTGCINCDDGMIHAYDKIRLYPVPATLVKWGEVNEFLIFVKTMAYDTAGLYRGTPVISSLEKMYYRHVISEGILTLLALLYFSFGLYQLFFFFRRLQDLERLYFVLFVIFAGFITLTRGQFKYLLTENFNLLKFLEYSSESLVWSAFIHFILFFFQGRHYSFMSCVVDAIVLFSVSFYIINYGDINSYFYITDYVTFELYGCGIIYGLLYMWRFRKIR